MLEERLQATLEQIFQSSKNFFLQLKCSGRKYLEEYPAKRRLRNKRDKSSAQKGQTVSGNDLKVVSPTKKKAMIGRYTTPRRIIARSTKELLDGSSPQQCSWTNAAEVPVTVAIIKKMAEVPKNTTKEMPQSPEQNPSHL